MEKVIAFLLVYLIIGAFWTFLAMVDYNVQHKRHMPIKSRWIVLLAWPLYLIILALKPKNQS